MAEKHLVRGALAGVAGGLAASWLMNVFIANAGPKLTEALQSDEENQQQARGSDGPEEDATMKAAEGITHAVTGQHLTRGQKETGGPVVHYSFGALMGGLYGALAEYLPAATAGLGTTFGGILFAGADLLAVPAFNLSPPPTEQPPAQLASPFAAHLVYGATTELVRRGVRAVL